MKCWNRSMFASINWRKWRRCCLKRQKRRRRCRRPMRRRGMIDCQRLQQQVKMLYEDCESYTPNLKIHKGGFLVLDLAVLKKPCFLKQFEKIGRQIQVEPSIVMNKYEDTLVSPDDLNLKLKAVILTFQSFQREFKPIEQGSEYPSQCTVYQYLRKRYDSYLTIGFKASLQRPEEMQQMKSLGHLKKIKLYSFDIYESNLELELPIMRKYVKELFSPSKKIQFHINIDIHSIQGLKRLKQQLIIHQYPIQYCVMQTNLIDLIQKHYNLTLASWQEIAFKYTITISKYIPSAIGCLMESYEVGQQEQCDIQSLMACFNHINTRNQLEQKQYKKYHSTGMAIPQPLLLKLLKDFTLDDYGHSLVKGDFSLYLINLLDALQGKYKPQQKYQYEEVGSLP